MDLNLDSLQGKMAVGAAGERTVGTLRGRCSRLAYERRKVEARVRSRADAISESHPAYEQIRSFRAPKLESVGQVLDAEVLLISGAQAAALEHPDRQAKYAEGCVKRCPESVADRFTRGIPWYARMLPAAQNRFQ